jgi:hypothetical protein
MKISVLSELAALAAATALLVAPNAGQARRRFILFATLSAADPQHQAGNAASIARR